MKRLFYLLIFFMIAFIFDVFADETGNTVAGTILKNDTTPAYNASITLHSTAMRTTFGCNCSSVAIDYSSDTGDYSSAVDNLVADEDCTIISQGDPCPPYIIPSIDYLWITVDGSTVVDNSTKLPDPQGYTESSRTRTWSSYTKIGTVYYGINAIFPVSDVEAPNVTLVSPLNNSLLTYPNINFQFNVSDSSLIQHCVLIINGAINKTKTDISKTSTNTITSTLNIGNYNWSINCTDYAGNTGKSETRNLTITDITAPYWSPLPSNQIVEYGSSLNYNVNAVDDFGSVQYFINDTIRFNISSSGLITNKTLLGVGIYWLNISAKDSSNNVNSTIISITVQDTTPPFWVQTPTNRVVYLGYPFYYDVNATDISGISAYFINDTTNFAIDSLTGIITNATALNLGTYYLNISVNDTYNNIRSALISINVIPEDESAPIISNVVSTTTTNSAKISWETNRNANATINYGINQNLGSKIYLPYFELSHNITISGLANFTLYYYNITACNEFNNCSFYSGHFITQQVPVVEKEYVTKTTTVTKTIEVPIEIPIMPCSERWQCTEWSLCSEEGEQTRTCYDAANCGTFLFKPAEVQFCVYKPPFKAPEIRIPKMEVPRIPTNLLSWIVAIFIFIAVSASTIAFIFSKRKKRDEEKVKQIISQAVTYLESQEKSDFKIDENKYSDEAINKLNSLKNYIKESLNNGFDKEHIKKRLQEKGWPENIINNLINESEKDVK